jgi:hypothetical protein
MGAVSAKGTDPPKPAKTRKTMSWLLEVAKPQAMSIGFRPKSSESGACIRFAKAYGSTNADKTNLGYSQLWSSWRTVY